MDKSKDLSKYDKGKVLWGLLCTEYRPQGVQGWTPGEPAGALGSVMHVQTKTPLHSSGIL